MSSPSQGTFELASSQIWWWCSQSVSPQNTWRSHKRWIRRPWWHTSPPDIPTYPQTPQVHKGSPYPGRPWNPSPWFTC